MHELIAITTDSQGGSVVSARELHAFLEVKSRFADWIKNRIIRYKFLEETDYVAVSKNLETGGWEHDYALTLDTAKELAMVERTDKGKQARQYFIEAEKALRTLSTAPAQLSTEQVLLQLMSQNQQLLAGQQAQLDQLRADIARIEAGQHLPRPQPRSREQGMLFPPAAAPVKPVSLRTLVNRKVNEYCGRQNVEQREAYGFLYKRMFYAYGVDVYKLTRIGKESLLDAVERNGHLERLYSLITAELTIPDDL